MTTWVDKEYSVNKKNHVDKDQGDTIDNKDCVENLMVDNVDYSDDIDNKDQAGDYDQVDSNWDDEGYHVDED